jgi:hypothetical protein
MMNFLKQHTAVAAVREKKNKKETFNFIYDVFREQVETSAALMGGVL